MLNHNILKSILIYSCFHYKTAIFRLKNIDTFNFTECNDKVYFGSTKYKLGAGPDISDKNRLQ